VAESASQPTLSDTRGAANCQFVMGVDPVATEQLNEESTVEAAVGAIVDIFWGGLVAKLGKPESLTEKELSEISQL